MRLRWVSSLLSHVLSVSAYEQKTSMGASALSMAVPPPLLVAFVMQLLLCGSSITHRDWMSKRRLYRGYASIFCAEARATTRDCPYNGTNALHSTTRP